MLKLTVYSKYIGDLLKLAWPMIMGSLGIILIGAGDVFVAARHSTQSLEAISIANSIVSTVFLFGIGLLASISPLLSNFRGERSNIKKYFLPTVNYSILLGSVSCLIIILSIFFIDKIGFEPSLLHSIKMYMFICAFSTFGAYLQIGLKEYLQAYEIVFFPNFLNIIGVFLNLFLNFIFVFGLFGFPEMGVIGLAIATVISRSILGLTLLFYCLRFLNIKKYTDFKYYINLLKIGFPISMAITLEVFAFNIITLIVGHTSSLSAAAHNILITITTATFMIPMAIANAIAVKVGYANGSGNLIDLKRYSFSGIFICLTFMAFCALCFFSFPKVIVNIFTSDLRLVQICVPIIILAGFFQIFDGLQVALGGVFKGLKKTNIIMFGDFAAYWLIGLPIGFLLAFRLRQGLFGFWLGLTIAIFVLALILLLLLSKELRAKKKNYS